MESRVFRSTTSRNLAGRRVWEMGKSGAAQGTGQTRLTNRKRSEGPGPRWPAACPSSPPSLGSFFHAARFPAGSKPFGRLYMLLLLALYEPQRLRIKALLVKCMSPKYLFCICSRAPRPVRDPSSRSTWFSPAELQDYP